MKKIAYGFLILFSTMSIAESLVSKRKPAQFPTLKDTPQKFTLEVLNVSLDKSGSVIVGKLKENAPMAVNLAANEYGIDLVKGVGVEMYSSSVDCAQLAANALVNEKLTLEVEGIVDSVFYVRESDYTPKIYFAAADPKPKFSFRCSLTKIQPVKK